MSKWVTAWGVPTSYVSENAGNLFEDTTFRNVFYNPIKGAAVRVRFTNVYGESGVKLERVSIAEWGGKASNIKAGTEKEIPLADCGNVILAGNDLVTDRCEYTMEAGRNYVISFYIKDITRFVTGYNKFYGDIYSPTWLSRGDRTNDITFSSDNRLELQNIPFFCGVDLLTSDDTSAVMAFGDSITARPWPDLLALRINEMGIDNLSVVRKAIGGNRILRDYRESVILRRRGVAAIERFELSVQQCAGISRVIMLEGINDIIHPAEGNPLCGLDQLPTVEELVAGYKFCCDIAHKYGAKFYLCTIMPTRVATDRGPEREELRNKVNYWIRTTDYIDGFIDFDRLTADKNNPSLLAQEYDSGDSLHPNLDGSTALCNAIPKAFLSL